MIQTASLVIPSPKINEKSLGCSSYFTIEMAATASVHTNSEHINMISIIDKVNGSYTPVSRENFHRMSICTTIQVRSVKTTNYRMVEPTPRMTMFLKFLKNSFLFML